MKNIAFHSNQLGLRGVEVALYDYAYYNETLLKNKSYIFADANLNLAALPKFKKRFEDRIFLYQKFEDCFDYVQEHNIEYVYYIKAGDKDGKIIPNTKNLIHTVFQNNQPHGEVYTYVSEWLAQTMNQPDNYVPHIVSLPEPQKNYRQKLNIPETNIVIGRYGGENDFDLPFVYDAIYKVLQQRSDITFLFMNTRPFGPNDANIIFVNGTHNLQNKSDFINTCDYMIHGRRHGESFGLAISEFLFHDKPVISWKSGLDKNHITLIGDKGLWYTDYNSVLTLLTSLSKPTHAKGTYSNIVRQFAPENVMQRFEKIFLS